MAYQLKSQYTCTLNAKLSTQDNIINTPITTKL